MEEENICTCPTYYISWQSGICCKAYYVPLLYFMTLLYLSARFIPTKDMSLRQYKECRYFHHTLRWLTLYYRVSLRQLLIRWDRWLESLSKIAVYHWDSLWNVDTSITPYGDSSLHNRVSLRRNTLVPAMTWVSLEYKMISTFPTYYILCQSGICCNPHYYSRLLSCCHSYRRWREWLIP